MSDPARLAPAHAAVDEGKWGRHRPHFVLARPACFSRPHQRAPRRHQAGIAGQLDAALDQCAGNVLKRSADDARGPVARCSMHDGNH
jgi:hypothetical protein